MSTGVNKVILIGHLGDDPDLQYTPSGKAVAKLSVATNQRWTDPSGNPQQRTDWHRVVMWDKLAETCAKHLAKGRQIFVEGRLQNRSYDDRDGIKRHVTEVIAHRVQFLGGGTGRQDGTNADSPDPRDAQGDPRDAYGRGRGSGHAGGRRSSSSGTGARGGTPRGGSQVSMDDFGQGQDREAADPEPGDPAYNDDLPF